MDFQPSESQEQVRTQARSLASKFDDSYWRKCDSAHEFPWDFYQAFADAGWLGIAIPEAYGGAGLGITEASILLEEVAASGAAMNGATALHLTIFGLNPVVKHGSAELKQRILPDAAAGLLHVAFGITEPTAGSDTPSITTFARWDDGRYLVAGQKVWTSKAKESSKVLLLARTTTLAESARRTDGMTLFLANLDPRYVTVREIEKLGRHAVDSNEVFYDDLPVDPSDVVGEVGSRFPTPPRWAQSRAHTDRRRGPRDRTGRAGEGGRVCEVACGFRASNWSEPGNSVPLGRLVHRAGGGRTHDP